MRNDGIPRSFQLAGHTIKVRVISAAKWKHGDNCLAIWLPDDYAIDICGNLEGTNRQQVFCHELTHALLDVAGHQSLSEDEDLVDRLGHLLQQALTSFK